MGPEQSDAKMCESIKVSALQQGEMYGETSDQMKAPLLKHLLDILLDEETADTCYEDARATTNADDGK
jgi:hypothetical protein